MGGPDRFRVWHKRLGKYVKLLHIHHSEENGVLCYGCIVDREYRLYDVEEVTLEQSNGDTDRHNKPIFEGDIVRFQHEDTMLTLTEDGNALDEPEFNDDVQVSTVERKGRITGDFGDFESWLVEWAQDSEYVFEVIGNIHENKGLLNEDV